MDGVYLPPPRLPLRLLLLPLQLLLGVVLHLQHGPGTVSRTPWQYQYLSWLLPY